MLTFETFSAVRAAGVEDAGECFRCQQVCRLVRRPELGTKNGILTTKGTKITKKKEHRKLQMLVPEKGADYRATRG